MHDMFEDTPELHKDGYDNRERAETILTEKFGDRIKPTERAADDIRRFKDGSFGMSEMGMMLYTNGYNPRGESAHYRNGMVYCDESCIFGIGYFAKERESNGHCMIVAPRGDKVVDKIREVIATLRNQEVGLSSAYIRQLDLGMYNSFLKEGMEPIASDPWHLQALEEDETFPHRIIPLDEVVDVGNKDGEIIKKLSLPDQRGFREKNLRAYGRFTRFLKRNNLRFETEPYTYSEPMCAEAKTLVESFFANRRQQGNLVGSSAEDYFPLIYQAPSGQNEKDYFSYLGRLVDTQGSRFPVAFFASERLGERKAGNYASVSMRFPRFAQLKGWNEEGYTAITQYAWLDVLLKLQKRGITELDSGGSETAELDKQKEQLGGMPEKTYWAVMH